MLCSRIRLVEGNAQLRLLSGPVLTCSDHPNSTATYPLHCAPVCFPVRSRTHDQFGLTVAHTGARGINHPASSLADVLAVLLRAGFVASAPGTPELCFSKYTLQGALRAKSAALESPKSMAIYSRRVAVQYLHVDAA